jgi:hypothetical protein
VDRGHLTPKWAILRVVPGVSVLATTTAPVPASITVEVAAAHRVGTGLDRFRVVPPSKVAAIPVTVVAVRAALVTMTVNIQHHRLQPIRIITGRPVPRIRVAAAADRRAAIMVLVDRA